MSSGTAPTAQALLEHAAAVRAMARGVLGDDDRVDDVVQDAFVAALSRERPPSRLRSWLASVGRRRAWDVRRKDAVRARHETAAAGAAASSSSPPAAELVERAQLTRRLVAEMLALDAPYRDVLLLRYWEGLPPREIAARLDAPVETVRTRIRRAHERLRARLDAAHGGDRRAWAATLAAWAGMVGGASATAVATSIGASAAAGAAAANPADEMPVDSSAAGHGITGSSLLAIAGGVVAITAVAVFWRPWGGNDEPSVAESPRGAETAGTQPAGTSSRGVLAAKPAGEAPAPVAAPQDDAEDADATPGRPKCCPGSKTPEAPKPAPPRGPLSVRGTVKDASGAPVAWFPITYLLRTSDKSIEFEHDSPAYTDEDGRYTIDGLFPGELWMSLGAQVDYQPTSKRTVALAALADGAAAPPQDFVVAAGIALAGEVTGISSDATAPVEVWLARRTEYPGHATWDRSGSRSRSLPVGTRAFRFTALQPGTYRLYATTAHARTEEVVPLYADRTDVTIPLRALAPWRGRVVASPPLRMAGSSVLMWYEDGERYRKFTCDRDGVFQADDMPAGRYRLQVENYTRLDTESGRGRGITTKREALVTLPVESGQFEIPIEPDDVGLWVRPPPGVTVYGQVSVRGSARFSEPVQWFRAESRDGRATMGLCWSGGVPDGELRSDGALLVRGLASGRSTLRVTALGFTPVEREVVVAGPMTLDVALVPARGRVVRAEIADKYWSVEARRVGKAEAWTRILWSDDRATPSDTTVPGERDAFLEPGEYDVRVVSNGHAPASLGPVPVEEGGEPLTLRFPTEPGLTLRGTLLTKAGVGATLLLHMFHREDDGSYRRLEEKATHAKEGPFTVAGLVRGRYRLSPSPDGEPVVAEVDLDAGDTTVEATLPR